MVKVSWEEAEKALAKVDGKLYLDSDGIAHITEVKRDIHVDSDGIAHLIEDWTPRDGSITISSVQTDPSWKSEWGIEPNPENHDLELLLKEIIYHDEHSLRQSEELWGASFDWAKMRIGNWSEVAKKLLELGNAYAVEQCLVNDHVTTSYVHAFKDKEARDEWVADPGNYKPRDDCRWRRKAISIDEAEDRIGFCGLIRHEGAEYTDAMYDADEEDRDAMRYGWPFGKVSRPRKARKAR